MTARGSRGLSFVALAAALAVSCGGRIGDDADPRPRAPASCAEVPRALDDRLEERPAPFCRHVRAADQDAGLSAVLDEGRLCCARVEGSHPQSCASQGMCTGGDVVTGTTEDCEANVDDGRFAFFHCSGGWVCCTPRDGGRDE